MELLNTLTWGHWSLLHLHFNNFIKFFGFLIIFFQFQHQYYRTNNTHLKHLLPFTSKTESFIFSSLYYHRDWYHLDKHHLYDTMTRHNNKILFFAFPGWTNRIPNPVQHSTSFTRRLSHPRQIIAGHERLANANSSVYIPSISPNAFEWLRKRQRHGERWRGGSGDGVWRREGDGWDFRGINFRLNCDLDRRTVYNLAVGF